MTKIFFSSNGKIYGLCLKIMLVSCPVIKVCHLFITYYKLIKYYNFVLNLSLGSLLKML